MKLIFTIIYSLCVGSFLNVLIYRIPRKENFILGRSYCPNCKHLLHAKDLIPILSYVLLKGKCRYCHEKISFRYVLVELLSGCFGIYCYYHFGFSIYMLFIILLSEIMLIISVIDIEEMIIPDELNFIIFILGLLRIFIYHHNLFEYICFALIIPIILFILNCIYKDCIGGGDIKLMFSMGLFMGKRVLIAFVISVLIAGIYAIYLLVLKKATRKTIFPFGPFLCLGCFLMLFFQTKILHIYRILFF